MNSSIQPQDIYDAALNIASQHGWEKTSVREISKAIGYSTIKIYSDFQNKEGLLRAIQNQGFQLLKNEYQRSLQRNDDDEIRLQELTVAHYHFALKHRTYYDLMFQMNGSTCSLPESRVLEQTSLPVRSLLESIAGKADKALFFHWWALAHGFVAITNADQTKEAEATALIRGIMRQFIKGIKP